MLRYSAWGLLFVCCVVFSGCSPLRGLIVTNVDEPGVVVPQEFLFQNQAPRHMASYTLETGKGPGSKCGTVTVHNILGLFAFGDVSVEGAADSAGINTIHTIDSSIFNFLGIYRSWTTKVTGE